MAGNRWIFPKAQLLNTPSKQDGIDTNTELTYRQLTASLIQDIGQTLAVTQQCINTAIVYMHRFYMVQSFRRFPQQQMATASIFLAAKVEEQARKLKHVIQAANGCLHHEPMDVKSDAYLEQAHILVINEDILLQTLGFDVRVDHISTVIDQTCQLIQASKDLAHTSYFLATSCLHLTTFCLQYKPSTVACICILLACQWSNWDIPKSSEGKEWYYYVDKSITFEMLEECIQEFLNIFDKCPSKLKKEIMGQKVRGKMHTVNHKELYSEAPPKKRQCLEITPHASTMTSSRFLGKSDRNIGTHIPSGHKEWLDAQPQQNNSTFSPLSGIVNKEQEQHTNPRESILYNSKSNQKKIKERPLSDNRSLQEKKKKSNYMSVKDYLERKGKEHIRSKT
ncbi:hypothetical protein ACJMK2_011198 [Sinanodonta woodiana]|uniref:Cyclin-like domain-containing protein n=1 Tax=Sinanodonta woodiana TaxID=1069815 RepID=A0ABD3V4R4_SINWO